MSREKGASVYRVNADTTLTVRHAYTCPPEPVFEAWIDPAVARRWLFATPGG